VLLTGNIRIAGNNRGYTDILIEGSVEGKSFVAFYFKRGRVAAVATMGRDPACSAACELLRLGKMPSEAEVRAAGGKVDLVALASRG
jgi:hypothetical protein